MNDKNKISIKVPPESLLDPSRLRTKQIQEEEDKRFNEIADKLLEVLSNEKVLVSEISRIMVVLTNKINMKFDNSLVEKIIKSL